MSADAAGAAAADAAEAQSQNCGDQPLDLP